MNAATQSVDALKLEQRVYLIRISEKSNSYTDRLEIVK